MPEGHTLHRVARDHGKLFAGERLAVASPQGRFTEGAERLSGGRLERVEALGKHLFYHWVARGRARSADVLHVHLGLYGKFRLHRTRDDSGAWPPPRGAVRLRVEGPQAAFDLNGPTRCELLDPDAYRDQIARLGPDPLRTDAEPDRAWERIARSRAPIGGLLMNQEVIAGLGNIYRCEVLHLLRIHPDRPGRNVLRAEFDALWERLVELMAVGVKLNRIVIADPADIGKPRSRMTRAERLRIYKKPYCLECGGPVSDWLIAGRRVYACEDCQT